MSIINLLMFAKHILATNMLHTIFYFVTTQVIKNVMVLVNYDYKTCRIYQHKTR